MVKGVIKMETKRYESPEADVVKYSKEDVLEGSPANPPAPTEEYEAPRV